MQPGLLSPTWDFKSAFRRLDPKYHVSVTQMSGRYDTLAPRRRFVKRILFETVLNVRHVM